MFFDKAFKLFTIIFMNRQRAVNHFQTNHFDKARERVSFQEIMFSTLAMTKIPNYTLNKYISTDCDSVLNCCFISSHRIDFVITFID